MLLFFFIIIGGLISLASGFIEFEVFSKIFNTISTSNNFTFAFTLSISFCFEIVKNFSSLIIPIICNFQNLSVSLKKFTDLTKKIRVLLVIISFICTFIYTGNILTKTVNDKNEIDDQIQKIETKYSNDLKLIDVEINKEYNYQLSKYEKIHANSQEELNKAIQEYGINSQTAKYFEKLESQAHDNYDNFIKNGKELLRTNKNFSKKIADIDFQHEKSLKDLNDGSSITLEQSAYLNNFLGIFNLKNETCYKVTVFTISVLISLIMEVTIHMSASFISKNSTVIFDEIDSQIKFTSEEKNRFQKIAKTLINALICLSIYLCIMMLCTDQQIAIQSAIPVYIAYIGTLIADKVKVGNSDSPKMNVLDKIKELFLTGLISFVLYIIMGTFLGNQFTDVSSIAVSIGAIIGKALNIHFNVPLTLEKN